MMEGGLKGSRLVEGEMSPRDLFRADPAPTPSSGAKLLLAHSQDAPSLNPSTPSKPITITTIAHVHQEVDISTTLHLPSSSFKPHAIIPVFCCCAFVFQAQSPHAPFSPAAVLTRPHPASFPTQLRF
jgi:hypothetical protein